MTKSAQSAYTDMMNNLAKSTVAIPVHLQGASQALAWWQSEDSLLAKAQIAPAENVIAKSHGEDEEHSDEHEAKESPAEEKAEKDEAPKAKGKKESDEKDEDEAEDKAEDKADEKNEEQDGADIYKSLDAIATRMLKRK